jgi:hypothetical protein
MAEDSAFWQGTTVGDAASTDVWSAPYNDAEFSDIYSKILGSNVAKGYVIPTYGNDLKVSANSPVALNVLIATGALFIRGRIYETTAQITATIEAADVTNPRLDRVIARVSLSSSVQTIRIVVLKGTAAATPALPALTQNATTYEISLGYVWVAANATTISDADVHDEREFAVNFREAAYKTAINLVRNSEFLGDIQSRIYAPADWDLVLSPSAILTATKPAQMVRGNYISITSDAASEGISQTIPVTPSTPYAIKALINVTAGDVGQIVVTTNSASPSTITRTIRRTGTDLEERIFYPTESDATTMTIKLLAVNSTDVIKFGQVLCLPGYNAGPYRMCSYNEDMILLDRLILTATQANLDFQNIPSGYRAIKIVASLRTGTAATSENITLRINNDSGANYDAVLAINSHSATLTTVENVAQTSAVLAQIPANTAPANTFGNLELKVLDYDNTSRNKAGSSQSSAKLNTTTGNIKTSQSSFFWRSNSVVTRITLISSSSFSIGSMIEIYLLR